jgi:hypothetical protein
MEGELLLGFGKILYQPIAPKLSISYLIKQKPTFEYKLIP